MIEVVVGELAQARADAVLRPVNEDWSAVTPAMRRLELSAGPTLAGHCERLGALPLGSAVVTPAGDLAAQFAVHVVVRTPREPVTATTVGRALLNGLRRLNEWALDSVALPLLGTGAGNLDAEESAEAMVPVLLEQLRSATHPSRVLVVAETEYERDAFQRALARHARAGEVAGNGAHE